MTTQADRHPGKKWPEAPCKVGGCDRLVRIRGFCKRHYNSWREKGYPENWGAVLKPVRTENDAECKVDGCGRAVDARGFCKTHYVYWRGKGYTKNWRTVLKPIGKIRPLTKIVKECRSDGCHRPGVERGLCMYHYQRLWAQLRRLDGSKSTSVVALRTLDEREIEARPLADPAYRVEVERDAATALGMFDPPVRKVLTMYYLDHMTMSEIAAAMNVSKTKVSRLLHYPDGLSAASNLGGKQSSNQCPSRIVRGGRR